MSTSSKSTNIISIILLVIMGMFIYANSLNGAFVWDDDILVKNNVYIKDWQYFPKLFTQDFGAGSGVRYNYYRPIPMVTHMVDYSLWGLNAIGHHLTNVLLHIVTTILLFYFVHLLSKDSLLARLTSILFLVHPIHTESVCNITTRMELLAFLFMLACFISYIKYLHKGKAGMFIILVVSYSLALLSKENSLMLPALLFCYHYVFKEKIKAFPLLTIAGLSVVYFFVRSISLNSSLEEVSLFADAFSRIPGFFVAIASYIRLLLMPFDLHAEYGDTLFQLNDPRVILGIVLSCASLLYALIIRKKRGLISFALLWFFVSLLPTSGIYPTAFYMSEHYLYMPSVGFFMILAWLLCVIYRTERLRSCTVILIVCLLTSYSYLTIKQNNYWSEPVSFYNRTLFYNPNNSKLYDKLGVVLYEEGKTREAIGMYKKALEVDPEDDSVHNNLGNAYFKIGQSEAAVLAYQSALELNPHLARAYYNLGNIYINSGQNDTAIDLLKRSIKENPDYPDAYNNLGILYGSRGDVEEAITFFSEAIRVYPKHAEAYNNLALIYFMDEKYQLSIEYSDKAKELGFDNPGLLERLRTYR